jgi:hypothetical protein
MVFVRPGQERGWEAAVRARIDGLSDDVYTARVARNLGQPNAYTVVIHTRTEDAARAIDLPGEAIDHLTDDVYRVVLSSDWPTAR